MPNAVNQPADELEGIPPKLYKLALAGAASALFMVLVVIGGVVWRLNGDCPAVQRDVRIALDKSEENHATLIELQRHPKGHTQAEWVELVGRIIRLEEYRAHDEYQMRKLDGKHGG